MRGRGEKERETEKGRREGKGREREGEGEGEAEERRIGRGGEERGRKRGRFCNIMVASIPMNPLQFIKYITYYFLLI